MKDAPFEVIGSFDPSCANMRDAFVHYYKGFLTGHLIKDRHHILKAEHTSRVMGNVWCITEGHCGHYQRRVALVAALFHDIGRFEQFARFGSFSDAASVNHGVLGAQVLHKQGFLQGEPPAFQRAVKTAVLLHNRREVPPALRGETLYALQVVRDADKLDIIRVLSGYLGVGCTPDEAILLHLQDEPDCITPAFENILKTSQPADYASMRYLNDFRMVLVSWLNQMVFCQSREMVLKEGYIYAIAEGLAGVPRAHQKAWMFLKEHGRSLQMKS